MRDMNLHDNIDTTFNYWCTNYECSNNKMIKIKKKRKLVDEPEYCSVCESRLKLAGEEYNCIATFGSKTSEQKKEIIKKRAKEHDRTKMKDRVPEIRKRIINNSLKK